MPWDDLRLKTPPQLKIATPNWRAQTPAIK
jgi:hypothetical protein